MRQYKGTQAAECVHVTHPSPTYRLRPHETFKVCLLLQLPQVLPSRRSIQELDRRMEPRRSNAEGRKKDLSNPDTAYWLIMVSSSHPGDTVTLLRQPPKDLQPRKLPRATAHGPSGLGQTAAPDANGCASASCNDSSSCSNSQVGNSTAPEDMAAREAAARRGMANWQANNSAGREGGIAYRPDLYAPYHGPMMDPHDNRLWFTDEEEYSDDAATEVMTELDDHDDYM